MAKLYYFDGRGKGEIIRLVLAAAGVSYTEVLLKEQEQFLNLVKEGKLTFGQVPCLEIDGKTLVQSNAIVRYIAARHGLRGQNLDEEVVIDMYYEGGRDFLSPFLSMCFYPEQDILEGPGKKAIVKYMPLFEKIAEGNGNGFLFGDRLTIADISLLEVLLVIVEYLGREVLSGYPAIERLFENLTSLGPIAAFLKSPQRKRKNDDRYAREVMSILGRSVIELCLGASHSESKKSETPASVLPNNN